MTAPRLFLDVHVLQTVPPSNLNRDDAGTPKQAIYGGARRARVSSQAWKRATRKYFANTTPPDQQATRTKRVTALLARRLAEEGGMTSEEAARLAVALLAPLKITPKKKRDGTPDVEGDTAYLLFFGRAQLEKIVSRAVAKFPSGFGDLTDDQLSSAVAGIRAQEDLMEGHPLDVALFGRMVADLAALNVDAAVQVAHALSTHSAELEYDYYTAVDDEKDRVRGDDLGAEMIGTVEFNSATLYRYANIGVHQLLDNLGGDGPHTVEGAKRFLEGFVRSMPTGHQNTFAHRTLPFAVIVVARKDQPVNLVSAFEKPVKANNGYDTGSLVALAKEYQTVIDQWGGQPQLIASLYPEDAPGDVKASFGKPVPFEEVLVAAEETVSRYLGGTRP
jgi:CRISPR system Cascade subunit CasC